MNVLLIAGGSGGHLMPVIAVAEELRAQSPGAAILVACSPRQEDQEILRRHTIPSAALPTLRGSWKLPWMLLRSVSAALQLLSAFHPDVIFSKGGALSLPLLWLAYRRGIPIILHESDAVMGRANQFAMRWADTVCLGFWRPESDKLRAMSYEQQRSDFSNSKLPTSPILHQDYGRQARLRGASKAQSPKPVITGNPIRSEILRGSRAEGLRITGFSEQRPVLLVLGGSQGALTLNRIIEKHLSALLELCDVIHITGLGKGLAASQPHYWARAFVDEELPHLYACATIALSRAGAGAISELAVHGVPTILVPLSGLAQDHQAANARFVEQTGGCIVLQQEMCDGKLLETIGQLLDHPLQRSQMADRMRSMSKPGAARHIAAIIVQTLASR